MSPEMFVDKSSTCQQLCNAWYLNELVSESRRNSDFPAPPAHLIRLPLPTDTRGAPKRP
jgi:hypothetical protein